MKYLKTYESHWTEQEYFADITNGLSNCNISPNDLTRIISEYENEILDYRDSGKHPSLFVNKIIKELELDKGGFPKHRTTRTTPWKQNYL